MTEHADFLQIVHTCYIPEMPRTIEGEFPRVFLKVTNEGGGTITEFVTDPKSDSPLDKNQYEGWLLEFTRSASLASLGALVSLRKGLQQSVTTSNTFQA